MSLRLLTVAAAFAFFASSVAFGQARVEDPKNARVSSDANAEPEAGQPPGKAKQEAAPQDESSVRVYLVGGRRLDVDELTESADGYWYRRGNMTTLLEKSRVERIERGPEVALSPAASSDDGSRVWSLSDTARVENFFVARFGRPLPVTAFGQSALHNRWGLDHRKSLDVGLHPDSREGRTLIEFLREQGIPFLAFRYAIPGAATAPHIHIGRPSPGLRAR